MDTVLLHCCCAPCSLSCIDPCEARASSRWLFGTTPISTPGKNTRPGGTALLEYAPTIGMEVRVQEEYGLRPFVEHVAQDLDHRCGYCYSHRIDGTAKYAAEHGFSAFTTTLLASIYQDHDRIVEAGKHCARQYGVAFVYRDFPPQFPCRKSAGP